MRLQHTHTLELLIMSPNQTLKDDSFPSRQYQCYLVALEK